MPVSAESVGEGSVEQLRATYIGHATLLLRVGGLRILTDPNFDPKLGVFLPRVSAPGLKIAELPRLDAIFLTHAHADHLSFGSLRALPNDVPIYAPTTLARSLVRAGFSSATAVRPGETLRIGQVAVSVGKARHMGARYVVDQWRGEALMYLFDDSRSSILFTGDTALSPEILSLARLVAPRRLDLALLPIGYAPPWKEYFFRRGHLTAADALSLFEQLDARILVPFHWGTFRHITSGAHDAIRVFRRLLQSHARASDVRVLEPGETLTMITSEK